MKKVILSILAVIVFAYVEDANAQSRATGAASDFRVPLTSPPPQANPAVGVNAVSAPALNVPATPPIQTLNTPSITAPGVMPAVPAAPAPPPAPLPGALPPASSFTTTLNLPLVPVLPPIPPIPAMPDIRLPIGTN